MSKTIKVKADETIFLAEIDESIEVSHLESLPGVPEGMQATVGTGKIIQEFATVKKLIVACSDEILKTINSITPEPEKITVEFGIKFAGESGVPTLTKASGEASFKISIEWKKS